ncbi:MAG: transcription termination/antitermination protein NusG [Acidimicrobiia bacterium]
MPDAVETAEMETPELETPDVESELDPTEVDTVELDPVEAPEPVEDAETADTEAVEPAEAVEVDDTAEAVEVDDTAEPVEVDDTVEPVDDTEAAEPVEAVDTETPDVAEDTETPDESEEDTAPVGAISASPYDLPGDWYVIHSYSGYENKVKANLETRIQSMHMEDRIFEVHIPMEDVVEFKAGKKVTVPKKVFPGYILVRMSLDDDSWYAVRNTPGVTGFVAGNAQKPTPLSRREVERFLGVQEEEEKAKPRFKPEWEVGEQVRVVTGPFADFNGVIEDMNVDQQKIVVLVNIFGRDTPVELGFEDIQKN